MDFELEAFARSFQKVRPRNLNIEEEIIVQEFSSESLLLASDRHLRMFLAAQAPNVQMRRAWKHAWSVAEAR